MDGPLGGFRAERAPTLLGWLSARFGASAATRSWPVVSACAVLLGVAGGLAVVYALRPSGVDAVALPQAVRVVVTTVPTTVPPAVVHVAGAVASPGVYPLEPFARVDDVVRRAGGARADADVARLNLAEPVADGSRVYVPAVGEEAPPTPVSPAGGAGPGPGSGSGGGGPGGSTGQPIDVNTATAAELEDLPGVGPATAAAIVAHRDEHGPFASVDSLDDVPGIGPAKVAALRDQARA